MREWPHCSRIRELLFERGHGVDQSFPCNFTIGKVQTSSSLICRGHTGAGDAIVEAENPYPAAIEDMMDSRIVDRIRRSVCSAIRRRLIETSYIRKVTIECLRCRIVWQSSFWQMQCMVQKASRASSVHHKPGTKCNIAAIFFTFERDLVAVVNQCYLV